MNFDRFKPTGHYEKYIAWYWCAESSDIVPKREKIVPDGYPEFVFHFGQPFRICLGGQWHTQGTSLLGGQMQQYFFLENTGRSGIFGVTFHPTALTHLFGLGMQKFTDQVVNLHDVFGNSFSLPEQIIGAGSTSERIKIVEDWLAPLIYGDSGIHPVDQALKLLREQKGLISMEELSDQLTLSNRQVQRLFQRFVGVSPKFYARIIRFNAVFGMIKQGKVSWGDVVHASGYYDQSHFIRNFQLFTGEDPTDYSFESPSLTNFFAHKMGDIPKRSHLYNTRGSSVS